MKPQIARILSASVLTCLLPLLAGAQTMDHSQHAAPATATAASSAAPAAAMVMTEGEVRKLDLETGKVTLKHGEIKNLDMPPMTMVFTATDKAMLTPLKVGDKVRFHVEQQSGKYMVTAIHSSK